MTDDLDSADHHSTDGDIHDKSKRGRFKDVLNRTRTKIADKVREEKEARKHSFHSDKDKPDPKLAHEVDEFLAAGRLSSASSNRPSIHSDVLTSNENLSANDEPPHTGPPTSEQKPHPSPRRIQVPRIDVSASQRFPNAKDVGSPRRFELPGSSALSSASQGSGFLLKPEIKPRTQSTSSIASAGRKARIRGLSVGFADIPPAIIGEGGDEAETPTIEISRAKMRRARSASPQPRNVYSNPSVNAHPEVRRPVPGRGPSSAADFVPKPFARVNTGVSPDGIKQNAPPDTTIDGFVPRPFVRTQTGILAGQSPVRTELAPTLPPRPKQEFLPSDLGLQEQGTMDLTREFEMSLGLTSGSPDASKPPKQQPQILAPKPQRAPPSYELIEADRGNQNINKTVETPVGAAPPQRNTPQSITIQGPPLQSNAPRSTEQLDDHRKQPDLLQQQQNQQLPASQRERQQQQLVQPMPSVLASKAPQQIAQQGQQPLPPHVPQQFQPPPLPDRRQPRLHSEQPLQQVSQSPSNLAYTDVPLPGSVSSSVNTYQSVSQPLSHPNSENIPISESSLQQEGVLNPHDYLSQPYQDSRDFATSTESMTQPRQTSGSSISRFASLYGHSQRHLDNSFKRPSPQLEPVPNTLQAPPLGTSTSLPPIKTIHNDSNTNRSFAERVQTNSRPNSLVGSPVTLGSPHSATIRRVSPSDRQEVTSTPSPSVHSSAVSGSHPHTPVDVQPGKPRFYESVNQGNPPTGYI